MCAEIYDPSRLSFFDTDRKQITALKKHLTNTINKIDTFQQLNTDFLESFRANNDNEIVVLYLRMLSENFSLLQNYLIEAADNSFNRD